jgi:hypothetical protein
MEISGKPSYSNGNAMLFFKRAFQASCDFLHFGIIWLTEKYEEIYPKKESHSKLLSKVYTIRRSCGRKLMYVVLYWGIIVTETMARASKWQSFGPTCSGYIVHCIGGGSQCNSHM